MENYFKRNLKQLRKLMKFSQSMLAEKLNTSVKTISHWETGYSEPSIDQLIELCKIFSVSLDDLIC